LKTNLKNLNESLRFSLPLLPHNIAIALTNLSDRFIIKHYLGLSALGIYSLGIQFHSLVLLVVTAFSQAFTPRYYKLMNERSLSQKQFNNTFIFSLVSITLISIIVFQVFPIVINLITNDVYMADYRFVGILLSSGLFQLGYVFSFAEISFFKKNKIIMYVTVTSVILNILFNFILIPKFHLTGAALAMSLTLFVRFCLLFYYSTKLTRHIYRWPLMEGFGILSLYLLDITISFVVDNINFQIYVNTIIVFIIIFYTIIRLDINEKFYFKIKKRG
jgi:O-antigen/teichoic acid export membrane protein